MGEDAEAFFHRTAAAYGRARYGRGARPFHRAFFGGRLRLAAAALERLPVGARVVDVGCGPSPLAPWLRSRGVRVVGVDFAAGMLEEARRAGAAPVRGDASAVPLRDGVADAVLLLGVTTYAADPLPLLREARRLLAPGGTLVVTATNAAAPDTRVRGIVRSLRGARRGSGSSLLAGVAVHAHRPDAFERLLVAAGLEPRSRRGHNFTVFPLGRLLEGPALALSRAAESLRLPAGLASDTVFVATRPGPPPAARPRAPRPIRVVRAIARLNVGGPAMHVALASAGLDRRGFRHVLLAGSCESGEADMGDFARERGVVPRTVPGLGRRVSPADDLRAFAAMLAAVRRERPHVVHTHTAKAGALGRVAAALAGVPVRIHTFHGHVLHGYFAPWKSALARLAERTLARFTHRVLAVSDEVRSDLVRRHGVAPEGKVTVVPLGLDLDPFLRAGDGEGRGALRAELGAAADEPLVGIVGRMVPVKDHAFFLAAAAALLRTVPRARIVLVGAGPLEDGLRACARELGIAERCAFLGWRRDTARLCADLDVVALTSVNEGTPVALIEAAAAGCRIVARSVGGVPSALRGVEGARLVPPEATPEVFAAETASAIAEALAARRRPDAEVVRRFSVDRLCDDLERIYRAELARAGYGPGTGAGTRITPIR